ncbi:MAG: hypothetical protein K5650_02290, partial [Bacteroidales bacterium]|nr:hypothetical protein [Bacteroidales bacterium]
MSPQVMMRGETARKRQISAALRAIKTAGRRYVRSETFKTLLLFKLMKKILRTTFLFVIISFQLSFFNLGYAQGCYWVVLKDKAGTT